MIEGINGTFPNTPGDMKGLLYSFQNYQIWNSTFCFIEFPGLSLTMKLIQNPECCDNNRIYAAALSVTNKL